MRFETVEISCDICDSDSVVYRKVGKVVEISKGFRVMMENIPDNPNFATCKEVCLKHVAAGRKKGWWLRSEGRPKS